jgi:hypothetical protein
MGAYFCQSFFICALALAFLLFHFKLGACLDFCTSSPCSAGPTVLFAAWLSGHVDALVAYPPQRPHFVGVATDGDSMQQSDGAAPLKSASLLWCGRSDADALRNPADEFVDLARDLIPCAALRAATAFRDGAVPLGAPLLLPGGRSDAIAAAADHVVHALVRSARGVHSVRCAWIARVRDLLRRAAPAPSLAAVAVLLRERALFQVAEEIDWRSWMPSYVVLFFRLAVLREL